MYRFLFFLFAFTQSVQAQDERMECPQWTGATLIVCAHRPDGSLERLHQIDARAVYTKLAGTGVKFTTEAGEALFQNKTGTISGTRQKSFFFPYTRTQTRAKLAMRQDKANRLYIEVEEITQEEQKDILGSIILVLVPVLCVPMAYLSRLMTSRINIRPIRIVGYAFLVVLVLFLIHFNLHLYQAVGFSLEWCYLLLLTILSGVGWLVARIRARSRRYIRNPYHRTSVRF